MTFSIQDFIKIGMLREIPELIPPHGRQLNLGAGKKPIKGAISIDLPGWNADTDPIPAEDRSVRGIWMLHFLEHVRHPIEVLKECDRVLMKGGFCNIVVPYYTSNLHHSDLDHKHTFTDQTFKKLFRQKVYYDKNQEGWHWDLSINFNLIIGVEEKNLALFTQLVKK